MGNRAVITTREGFKHQNEDLGVYLHWNGGYDSVRAFLAYCKFKGYRRPEDDNYGWAYLCTTIGNFFGNGLSLGIDTVARLDTDNYDNGTYIIEDWEIVDLIYEAPHHEGYDLEESLYKINERQPESIKEPPEKIKAWVGEYTKGESAAAN